MTPRNKQIYNAITETIITTAKDDVDAYYLWMALTDMLLNMYQSADHNPQLQGELCQSLEYLLKTIKNEPRVNLN